MPSGYYDSALPYAPGELDVYVVSTDNWVTVQPAGDPVHGSPCARSSHGFARFRSPTPKPALAHARAVLYHGATGPATAACTDDVWVLSKGDDTSDDWDIRAGWAWHRLDVTGDDEHDPPECRTGFPSASWLDAAGHTQAVMFGGILPSGEHTDELWELEIN